ncbi:transposase [Verrucomicrobiota bacterium sgz303538]
MELRVCTVELRGSERPGGRLEPLSITVVEARERRAAKAKDKDKNDNNEEEPLHWVLLTSLPADTLLKALEVVVIYRERWLIENYHKALKSGTGVERFQLESADALESVIGIVAVIAVRLLGLQLLAAKAPQAPLPAHCSDPQVLAILEARFGPPENGWTVSEYLRALAKLGGFLGRKSDGSPGWMTLWRGVRELSSILTVLDLLTPQKKCG